MSSNKSSQSLRTEVSKLARLSNIQGGLPPLMRGLPVLAIMAGGALAKATDGQTMVEERMLGADEVFELQSPQITTQVSVVKEIGRPGVNMMCRACGQKIDGSLMPRPDILKTQNILFRGVNQRR
ncbi:Ff.00g068120.m01.CDS01 [Fusarium sp. VM40]|nr:Ff.00g068120.m01.CDS01 [Fusarium sp. VM40]